MGVGVIVIVVVIVACAAIYVLQRSKSQRAVGAFRSSPDSAPHMIYGSGADDEDGTDSPDLSDSDGDQSSSQSPRDG